MFNKSIIFGIFTLLIFSNAAFAIPSLPKLIVSSIVPQPAEPGQDVTLTVRLYNPLGFPTDPVKVKLDAAYPFIFKSAEENFEESVVLCATCSRENTYFLTVNPNAVSGIYPVFFRISNSNAETTERVDIEVKGKPNIVFTTDSTGLDMLVPNTQFSVLLDIKNIGTGSAYEIEISSKSEDFISLGSSVKTISSIEAKNSDEITFDFIVNSELATGSYNIPLEIKYKDDRGNKFNSSGNIGVNVVNKAEINVQNIKIASDSGSSLITTGMPFTSVVRLENTGYGKADFITAEVSCPFNDGQKAFLGQLERDEDAPAVFNMISNQAGMFTCSLVVNYKDDLGNHTLTEEFGISIVKQGPENLVAPVIIILIIAFVFRKRLLRLAGVKGKHSRQHE